ncbi:hypothetical protein Syn7502_02173 [Synechococcus sp. PCC 7502]|uniref:hypothetical protein n=1 Tax=Synechococcus sp. PCC 7502 TaxID=1173263 RepID=UPI00029F9861|nr:hypothetical protein [Synechococcus sp. PCC 7502]AFY74185.1 hypothetical protein Syn7502_02173 [Synechococcus sp. PCC 7502]
MRYETGSIQIPLIFGAIFIVGLYFGEIFAHLHIRHHKFRVLISILWIIIISFFHLCYLFSMFFDQVNDVFWVAFISWIISFIVIGLKGFTDLIFVSRCVVAFLFLNFIGLIIWWQIAVESRLDGSEGVGVAFGWVFIHFGGLILPLLALGFTISAANIINNYESP